MNKLHGPSAYDDPAFFEQYIGMRQRPKATNDTLEKPIIDRLIGDVAGKDVLELGCGDGSYGKELLDKGARSYTGIDGSENMITLAREQLREYPCTLQRRHQE